MRCFTGRMDYTIIPPPLKANSGWMGHHVKLYVKPDRHQEFVDYLSTYCGKKHVDWRIRSRTDKTFWIWGDEPTEVRFKLKKHAALLKLQWEEDPDPKESLWGNLKYFSKIYSGGIGISHQSIGRGIRNTQMTTTKPRATTIYDIETYPMRQDVWDNNIFFGNFKTPRPEGESILTIKQSKARSHGTRSEQTKVRWDPEALYLRDELLPEPGKEERSGDSSPDVGDNEVPPHL